MTNSMGSATLIAAALVFAGSGFAQTAQAQNVQTPTVVRGSQPLTGSANGGVLAPQPMTDAQVNSEALNKTQNLLRNPGERQKAMANDPKAQAADSKVKALLGPNTEKARGFFPREGGRGPRLTHNRLPAQAGTQYSRDAND